LGRFAAARWAIAAALSLIPFAAHAALNHLGYPRLVWPIATGGSSYAF